MDQDIISTTVDDDNGWSFHDVHNFLQALRLPSSPLSNNGTPPTLPLLGFNPTEFDPKASTPNSLGDFNRLYQFCGIPIDRSITSRNRYECSESSSTDTLLSLYSTSLSSAPDEIALDVVEHFDDFVAKKAKEVRWKDEVPGLEISESQWKSTHTSVEEVDYAELGHLLEGDSDTDSSNIDNDENLSVTELHKHKNRFPLSDFTKGYTQNPKEVPKSGFVHIFPATVTQKKGKGPDFSLSQLPPFSPPQRSDQISFFDSRQIEPIYALTVTEKKARLIKKLRRRNLLSSSLNLNSALSQWGGNNDPNGLHIFVDLSNIVIGFYNHLKWVRGIPETAQMKPAPISYHSLAFIFERGRPVAHRVVAGSHFEHLGQRPDYMHEAEKCGYQMNILEPVYKTKSLTPIKKRKGTGHGYATTSGQSSESDARWKPITTRTEQAVDEILHLKMLESLLETSKPSTIVLASGDGAEAEYSGGFFKYVELALKKGWKVEVVAWMDGLSKEYQSKSFLKRWEGQFYILPLDDFSEELLAIYASCDWDESE
ncbi:hypothetical protein BGZ60DRAFT_566283 [Tricladium varicosporioides]|nr:hypothetical protein BGZ60DRAFT_566283 [Hymenoscyphus varicosporioides]